MEEPDRTRRRLTSEEIADAVRELEILRDQIAKGGGLELKHFLPELEKLVAQS